MLDCDGHVCHVFRLVRDATRSSPPSLRPSPKARSLCRFDELVLLLPIVAILVLVSSQTGFTIHSRYVLPILPFLYVWCSKVACSIKMEHKAVAIAGALALCWSVGSSLWYYPHSLSYFNELVGGPKRRTRLSLGQQHCVGPRPLLPEALA